MNLIAEISLAGKVLLTAVVASTSFSPSGLGYGGSITIERTDDVANADDLYVGMPIRIAGLDAGCVHDYDAETLRITFGFCANGTAMTAAGNVTSNLDTVDATDMPIGTTATSTTVSAELAADIVAKARAAEAAAQAEAQLAAINELWHADITDGTPSITLTDCETFPAECDEAVAVYAPPPTLIERLRAWLAGWWAE